MLSLVLAVSLILAVSLFAVPAAADDNIRVILNGEELEFDVPPMIIEGRTMVPVRAIFEAFGMEVEWIDRYSSQSVAIITDFGYIYHAIGGRFMTVRIGDYTIQRWFDVRSQIVDGRTLVPIRAVSDAVGANVDWDVDTRIVTIEYTEYCEPRIPSHGFQVAMQRWSVWFGGDNEQIQTAIQFGARNEFKQIILPYIIVGNRYAIIDTITSGVIPETYEEFFRELWQWAADILVWDYLIDWENVRLTDIDEEWQHSLMDETVEKFELLSDQHIMAVTLEEIDDETTAIIIELYEICRDVRNTLISIVYHETYGLSYFSSAYIGSSMGTSSYTFDEVNISQYGARWRSYGNMHGVNPTIPMRDVFFDEIYAQIRRDPFWLINYY